MNEKDLKETKTEVKSETIKTSSGKEFKSVEEVVRAYEEAEKLIGKQGQKLGEFKKGLVREMSPTDNADYSKVEEELFDKPVEVFKQFKQNVKSELRNEILAEKAESDAWNSFFTENKDLAKHADKIKNDTYTRLWPSIADKPANEQFEAIKKEWSPFAAMSDDTDSGYEDTDGRSTGASTAQSSTQSKDTSSAPASMTSMLKKQFGS